MYTTAVIKHIYDRVQVWANRAALDRAVKPGIPHGVAAPRGSLAERGPVCTPWRLKWRAGQLMTTECKATAPIVTRPGLTGKCFNLIFVLGLMPAAALCGQDKSLPAAAASGWKKPAWLTEASVGVKESYDDNLFLSGVDGKYLPAHYTVPPGSVAALKGASSWATTVSPRIGFNFAPLLGTQNLQTVSLVYAPDFANYHDAASENNNAQRFGTAIKGQAGAFAFILENNLTYVDGNTVAPTYPCAMYSAIGIGAPRERREQVQDRSTISLRYDTDCWFIRPTASLLYYDMMTELINVTGYQNYCDRYDVNGGADLGYKLTPQMAVTIGYRYGHQYQEQFSFSPYSSPSDYQRLLAGFEGAPWKWLEIRMQAGPDFRSYPANTLTHITPVDDKTPIKYYGEAMVTAKLTPEDALILKYKQFQWVSSLGKVPYYDSILDLSYHRTLTGHFSVDLGARAWDADYNSGNLETCRRDDWQYTLQAGTTYTVSTHLSANLAYSLDLGRNGQDHITNPQTREYNRNLFSGSVILKF